MRHSTPFFQGFSSILFGRPALSGVQKTLRKVASLNPLSDFFATFGLLVPEALLQRRAEGANSRQRRFTLHVTFWAFLAQTLAPQTSCRDIVRKVQAWWLLHDPEASPGSPSTSAYTKARQRLDPEAIRPIARHLAGRLESRVRQSQLWRGRRVDGVSPDNRALVLIPSNYKCVDGVPIIEHECIAEMKDRVAWPVPEAVVWRSRAPCDAPQPSLRDGIPAVVRHPAMNRRATFMHRHAVG
jgi:hypothetical protein